MVFTSGNMIGPVFVGHLVHMQSGSELLTMRFHGPERLSLQAQQFCCISSGGWFWSRAAELGKRMPLRMKYPWPHAN